MNSKIICLKKTPDLKKCFLLNVFSTIPSIKNESTFIKDEMPSYDDVYKSVVRN